MCLARSVSVSSHRRQDMDGLSHRNVESAISYELPYNESSPDYIVPTKHTRQKSSRRGRSR